MDYCVIVKRVLRIAFFMIRKGLMSKRKLIMDMNLMMKRGKVLKKNLGNLMFHHHSKDAMRSTGVREYEFSCNSPANPVFFQVMTKRKRHYFPCISVPDDDDDEEANKAIVVLPKISIDSSPDCSYSFHEFAPPACRSASAGDNLSPLKSPFSVRVSNYSEADENDCNINMQVDVDAEDFIRRFYEQLRLQSRAQLLQNQEMQYQEMLARGTR